MIKLINGESLNAEQMIEQSQLDWTVSKCPVYLDDKGESKAIPGLFVTKRDDTGHVFGAVGSRYHVLQNKTAFSLADAIVGLKDSHYVGAGSFRNGARVFLQIKMNGSLETIEGDNTDKLLLVSTSHDGSSPVDILFTPVRVICQNTLLMAIKGAKNIFSVRHTDTMESKLQLAKSVLNSANDHFSLFEKLSRELVKTPFDKSNLEQYIKKVGLIPNEIENSTRAKNILDDISNLFENGKGMEIIGVKGTAWGAYNAVTEYVDHFRGRNKESQEENRYYGVGASIKEKALELLVK